MLRAPPSNTRWGGKAHPRPRQRRMQLDEKNKQFPAVASITHRPVSGQASEAGRAARKAHSESQADRPENECIHFPAGFPLPGNSLGEFHVPCANCLFSFSGRFAGMGPGGEVPWFRCSRAEEALERLPPFAKFQFIDPILIRS